MMILLDQASIESILEDRRAKGNRTREEVWEGVTYIMPDPNNEHQRIALFFGTVFSVCFGLEQGGDVEGSPSLSDRVESWTDNFRNPDMAYFSPTSKAEDHGSFWYGGPDFLLEIVSPGDICRDKLPFYASIGTKEVLILDRDPWKFELYQLKRGRLRLTDVAHPGHAKAISSGVVPLSFQLIRAKPRPKIRIRNTETDQEWKF